MVEDKIRVFLVDDEPIALEGWKKLLEKVDDFQIVGESATRTVLTPLKNLPPVDIVLIGANLLKLPARKRIVNAIKKSAVNTKIVLIAEKNNDVQKAQIIGVDEAIQSPYRSSTLLHLLRGLHQDPKKRCAYYVDQLDNLKSSNKASKIYEVLISDILEFLFDPHLTDRYLKFSTQVTGRECSLFFLYKTSHPFWEQIRLDHNSHRLIFDIGNTSSVEPFHIERLSQRLTKEIGDIGIMVNHVEVSAAIQKMQIATYKNDGKVILFMTNSQLRNMLMHKAAGIDPTELLQDIYEEFITEV
jgi:DNA-binding NarL/FixJ family response regulator